MKEPMNNKKNYFLLLKITAAVYFCYYLMIAIYFIVSSSSNYRIMEKVYQSSQNLYPLIISINSVKPMYSKIGNCSLHIVTSEITIEEADNSKAFIVHPCDTKIKLGKNTIWQSQNDVHIFFTKESINYLKKHTYVHQRANQFYCIYIDTFIISLLIILSCSLVVFYWYRRKNKINDKD